MIVFYRIKIDGQVVADKNPYTLEEIAVQAMALVNAKDLINTGASMHKTATGFDFTCDFVVPMTVEKAP